ncbi:MAG TPA: hypothetical protein VGF14_06405, partial [Alphaproteobacteria bacterium]
KDMFRKQQDMGVLKALQSSPAEERLKIISLMKTTEPTAQDNMIKASVMVSLFSENKGIELYQPLIPTARKLLAQWQAPQDQNQQAVIGQLKSFVSDSAASQGEQLKLF